MCGSEKSEKPVLGEAYDARHPQDLGSRCLAKRVQGATYVRCPERLSACFGMRMVDGHGVRPQELGPIFLVKRVQGQVRRASSQGRNRCLDPIVFAC